MAVTTTNLGVITAYGDAVAAGYTGTKAEWQALMASYATVGQQAVDAKNAAVSKAAEATTAATTATAKASEASASAQSIAQSAAQIQENTDDIDQLKSEITDKSDTADMLKAFPTDTASGSVASFADGANVPVKSLIVNIDPVQSGSGDPSPDNVRPISGWSEVNVGASGKNLAELTDPPLTTNTSQVVAQLNQKGTFNYTVSFDLINATYQTGSGALIALVDENDVEYRVPGQIRRTTDGEYLNALTQPINGRFYCTFVSKVNPVRVTIFFMSGSYGKWTGEMKNLQVELGATPTDFEPYNGQNINISLGQTVYGGTLDVTNGELVIDNICINPSDFTISRVSGNGTTTTVLIGGITQGKALTAISNRFSETIPPDTAGRMAQLATEIYVILLTADLTSDTNNGVRDWFSNNPTQICYELATPVTVQLTPHEVTALLGSNNVWADSGDTTVEYRADPTLYIGRLTEPDADMIADANIVSGQYFMVGNTLYKATANIASGATISPNVNCTRKSLSEALNELNA